MSRDGSHGAAYTPLVQTARRRLLFAPILPARPPDSEPSSMISLYRWQPGQKRGTWAELPDLPANAGTVPEGEVWWIDLDDPSAGGRGAGL